VSNWLSHPGRSYGCFLNRLGLGNCQFVIVFKGVLLPKADFVSGWLQSQTWRCRVVFGSSPDRKGRLCKTSSIRPPNRSTMPWVWGDLGGVRRCSIARAAMRAALMRSDCRPFTQTEDLPMSGKVCAALLFL